MKIFQEKMKQIYSPKKFILKITRDKALCDIYKKMRIDVQNNFINPAP